MLSFTIATQLGKTLFYSLRQPIDTWLSSSPCCHGCTGNTFRTLALCLSSFLLSLSVTQSFIYCLLSFLFSFSLFPSLSQGVAFLNKLISFLLSLDNMKAMEESATGYSINQCSPQPYLSLPVVPFPHARPTSIIVYYGA